MAREKEMEAEVVVPKKESDAKVAFRALIEKYKGQNPEKYKAKKEELEKKLNSL